MPKGRPRPYAGPPVPIDVLVELAAAGDTMGGDLTWVEEVEAMGDERRHATLLAIIEREGLARRRARRRRGEAVRVHVSPPEERVVFVPVNDPRLPPMRR